MGLDPAIVGPLWGIAGVLGAKALDLLLERNKMTAAGRIQAVEQSAKTQQVLFDQLTATVERQSTEITAVKQENGRLATERDAMRTENWQDRHHFDAEIRTIQAELSAVKGELLLAKERIATYERAPHRADDPPATDYRAPHTRKRAAPGHGADDAGTPGAKEQTS